MVNEKDISPVNDALLLVVDMQVGFLNEYSSPIVPSVARLVRECDQRSLPIVFTKFINRPSSSFESFLDWTSVREKPETDLLREFSDLGDLVVEKYNYSAFTDELDRIVVKKNYRTILIAGLSTESCVLKTAVDAFERGIRPIVVSDACASDQSPAVHLQALDLLTILIGGRQIKTIDRILRELDTAPSLE